ncbi:DUF2946 domain-containing protein [Herbaspirillum sp. RV1423]|uniref:DUF2946 domain-containing protein n=1 Tax=Herbaspirillum sp. RV1423 TaxID=1443993 RepID=UPI0004AF19BB|nr:DUF2946 domain-containing protein [Herbaspirillum sp. RV1423]
MGKRKTIRLTITTWAAILAMLMMALAPSISHALSASAQDRSGGAFWMEICSAFGKSPSAAAASGFPDSSEPKSLSASCPYCLMHADATLPPHDVAAGGAILLISYFLPGLFYCSPQPLFAWTVASSRAPPTRS